VRGDNARVMQALLPTLRGRVDLAYIDPPFDLGIDHKMRVPAGDGGQSEEVIAYRDRFGAGGTAYLEMLWERLVLVRELLADTGSLLVHCDWHQSHLIRTLLGELFGTRHFVNEIVWWYYNKIQGNVGRFAANHDVILWFRKGDSFTFHPQHEPRERPVRQLVRVWDREKRALVNARDARGRVHYRESATRSLGDVWRLPMLQPADRRENTGYATQKPEALLERIVRAASNEGDLVADVFCGSGTTAAVAARLGRRWLAVDAERLAVHVARKRLIGVQAALGSAARSFEVCALEGEACAPELPNVSARARLRPSTEGPAADVELDAFGPGLGRLDFWAVDFLPEPGASAPFVPRWCSYRTRRDPALALASEAGWRYSGPGPHRARVQAIDVLGREAFCEVSFEDPAG
jgi:DNA modification methylase